MMTAFFNAASTSTLALQLQSRMGSRQFTETRSWSPMTGKCSKVDSQEFYQFKLFARNLRLKAHTADCAVNSIKEFVKWVKTIKKWYRYYIYKYYPCCLLLIIILLLIFQNFTSQIRNWASHSLTVCYHHYTYVVTIYWNLLSLL